MREGKAKSPGWIPLHGPGSRKPTEEDADDNRLVLFRHDGGRPWIGTFSPYGGDPTHWHAISKFTPAPDPDIEKEWTSHKVGAIWRESGFKGIADVLNSLAHRDAKQKARS